MKKLKSDLFTILALFFMALAVVITEVGTASRPVVLKTPPEAEERVQLLLDSVGRNDYAAISTCLLGNPALGVDREPANSVGSLVWNAYTKSFRYTMDGGFYATDNGLARNVTVSFLDIADIMTGLNDRAQALLAERVKEAEHIQDVYDDNHEFREDVVLDVLRQAVEEALEQRGKTVTVQLQMNLVHQDGEWWVLADTALLGAISGNTL